MGTNTDAVNESNSANRPLVDASGEPTPRYVAYLKYQKEYNDKVTEHQSAYMEAQASPALLRMWPIVGKQYIDKVNDAMKKWTVLGYKNEIEKALNTVG